ncbi:metallophosphoesterase [Candidatus Gracilibacteria bacterium]|nr:MAG: metallophosphoesterase [Candidatus Gracilibacteria bacterium]
MIKVLIFGDVYGRIGRAGLKQELDNLIKKYSPDFKIANIDNISYGKGAIEKHIIEFEKLGFDVLTTGNHYFDNLGKIKNYIQSGNSKIIRCANFLGDLVGDGYKIIEKNGKKILVIHLLGQIFMGINTENPFRKADEIIEKFKNEKIDGIIIDFHKETSSEGYGLLHYLDGKVSFIFGTHTHVQTNDEIIFPKGTGFISDIGMSGPLYSVIGADFLSVKSVFLNGYRDRAPEQSLDKNYIVNGVYIEIGDNGKCTKIEKIKITGSI